MNHLKSSQKLALRYQQFGIMPQQQGSTRPTRWIALWGRHPACGEGSCNFHEKDSSIVGQVAIFEFQKMRSSREPKAATCVYAVYALAGGQAEGKQHPTSPLQTRSRRNLAQVVSFSVCDLADFDSSRTGRVAVWASWAPSLRLSLLVGVYIYIWV